MRALGDWLKVQGYVVTGVLKGSSSMTVLYLRSSGVGASVDTPEVHWWTRQAGCVTARVAG